MKQAWWYKPVFPAFGRQRRQEFKLIFSLIYERPCLNRHTHTHSHTNAHYTESPWVFLQIIVPQPLKRQKPTLSEYILSFLHCFMYSTKQQFLNVFELYVDEILSNVLCLMENLVSFVHVVGSQFFVVTVVSSVKAPQMQFLLQVIERVLNVVKQPLCVLACFPVSMIKH